MSVWANVPNVPTKRPGLRSSRPSRTSAQAPTIQGIIRDRRVIFRQKPAIALIAEVLTCLKDEYPDAKTELRWEDPLQLLVATMLSAQSTDVRVNRVTQALFEKYHTAKDYAETDLERLEEEIRPVGFYRNKARAIKGMAHALVEDHSGEVPRGMEDLVRLPGVGRKTANVVLGNAFGINEGVVVDTHVRRVSNRLGLSEHHDPEKIERDLLKIVPEGERTLFSHLLIFHGRSICKSRKPDCPNCVLNHVCPSAFIARKG